MKQILIQNTTIYTNVFQVEEKIEIKASPSNEVQIREDFLKKKEELEKLQGEQMRLQLMQLEELQLKHDLIKKKQEQERQELIKQQQAKILQMRLQEENITSTEVEASRSILPAPFLNHSHFLACAYRPIMSLNLHQCACLFCI